jgi:hypothetical protein
MTAREIKLLKRLKQRKVQVQVSFPKVTLRYFNDPGFSFTFELANGDIYTDMLEAVQAQIFESSSVAQKKESDIVLLLKMIELEKTLTNKTLAKTV